MRRDPVEEIETETYRECMLCCGIIDKDDRSLYFWDNGKLANVCRNCAGKLLREGSRIFGIKILTGGKVRRKTELRRLDKKIPHF